MAPLSPRDLERRGHASPAWACGWCARSPPKTNDIAGDGTTTAIVLAHAIVREGAKAVAAGHGPDGPQARHRPGGDGPVVKELAEAQPQDRAPQAETAQVGTISANGEAEIGKLIAEAMQQGRQ
jgi:chaperonin GroEL